MTRLSIDPGSELQRTREELRALLTDDVEEAEVMPEFPRSMTMRLLINGIGHRLAWSVAGGVLKEVPAVRRILTRTLPLTTLLGLLWKRTRA